MRSLSATQPNAARRADAAPRAASKAQRARLSPARAVALVLGLQILLPLGLAAAAQAGPCTEEIAAFQVQLDAFLEATAAAGPSRPQRSFAGLHRQPTPAALAHAEQSAKGEQAVAALARARKADQAGNAALCRAALADARRALER